MRTARAALAFVLLLGLPSLGLAWQNTAVIEAEIVSVDKGTHVVEYLGGNEKRARSLFVPQHIVADLSGIEPGAFAMIEFELDTGRRELVGFRVPGVTPGD